MKAIPLVVQRILILVFSLQACCVSSFATSIGAPSGPLNDQLMGIIEGPAPKNLTPKDSGSGPNIGALVNAASYTSPVAPGSIVSLFISGFTFTTTSASTVPLLTTMGGATVTVNGTALPLFYVSSTQINAQVPYNLSSGDNTVIVSGNGATAQATFSVAAAAPGIYMYGNNQAIVQNLDGTLNSASNPSARGSVVVLYANGQGVLDHTVPLGGVSPSQPLARATVPTQIIVGGLSAEGYYVGMTPGLVALLQVNLAIPSGLTPGTYPIQLLMGSTFSNGPPSS